MTTITKDKRLNADEVMCLQMHGMSTPDLLRTDIDAFNRLLDEHEEFDDYLERANSILDRQEALGIETISRQDADFPASLTAIGRDCPAVIHCLGNIDLLKAGKAVAVIGARSCDRQGFDAAYKAAQRYTRQGNVIVSGLAPGMP